MRNLPPQVAEAIAREDTYALKCMGRKGGRASQRKREIMRMVNKIYQQRSDERPLRELHERAQQANEDVVPVDDSPMGQFFFNPEE
jgi:hypothetical protein